jgi:hypothetical protein
MKKKLPAKTANDWLAEIMRETTGATCEPVPEGWLSLESMCALSGVCRQTMQHRVEKLVREGRLERKRFSIQLTSRVSAVWHYHPAK